MDNENPELDAPAGEAATPRTDAERAAPYPSIGGPVSPRYARTDPEPSPEAGAGPGAQPAGRTRSDVPGSQRSHPTGGLRVWGRVWSLRTVAAAAITAVALSGAGGAALAAASDGGSPGPGGQGGFAEPGQPNGRFPGGPGQQFGAPGQGGGAGDNGTGTVPGGPPVTGQLPGQPPPATSGDQGRDT